MSRSNRNRLQGLEPTNAPDADLPISEEGSFSFVVPTEIVELPSKGVFYPEGHPLHGVETVEIKHMTAKEEDILTSKALLKKGLAIDRLLNSVIVDKRIEVDDLLIGDKNAILVATRITGYGEDYETNVTCPTCGNTEKHSFDLGDLGTISGDDIPEGVTLSEEGTFTITLPAFELSVGLKLLTGREENYLMKLAESKQKKSLPESHVTDQLKMIICSVQGNSSPSVVEHLVECLPASDSRYIQSTYDKVVPNIDLRVPYECSACGYGVEDMGVPLTAAFFWPER